MLRHDAEERPTPEAVAAAFAALDPSTARLKPVPMPARRRRWLVGAALAGTLATAAAAAAIASQGGADAEAPARDEAMPHRVAVAPITGSYAAWAVSAPSAGSVAEAVARLLDNVRGMSAVPIPAGTRAEQLGAAKTRGADLLLAGGSELALDPANGSALVLVDVATGREQHYIELAPAALEELIAGVTTAVARRLAPGPEGLGDAAAVSLELGLAAYSRNNWQGARLYFEQAVRARPDFARAWFYVAWARGWSGTMRESAREAADRAEKTARTPLERELARAVGLFNAQRYREAAPVATALVEEHPNNIDVLYTAAEALFHDGQIAAALELFDRCLEIEPRFQPAASHPHHAALARGDIPALKRYASLIDRPFRAEVAYLSGNDEEALRLGLEVRRLELINRDYRNADAEWGEEASVEGLAYRMIRAAQQGRRDLGGADFARSWPALARAASEPSGAYALGGLVQALIIAEYPAPLRTLQRWWDRHETPSNLMTGAELAMFAAPLLGGRDRPGAVSSRLEEVGRALAAEADGRPGVAADILAPLVAQPVGGGGDNLIRHAHLRALARAGRRDELIASCRRWDRPGTWSMSSLALRDYCDRQRAAIQR
jgi:tetratricopeptide (TPR) repeat protein